VRVATERFGDLEIEEERVLTFPEGLPGFPTATQFALIEVPGNEAFLWLQSLEDPSLAFLSAIPWPFFPDYEPEVPDAQQELLELTDADDALVLCLLTVRREEREVTANLLGPLVVNKHTRIGRQVVLADSDHPLRAPLVAA
jgi:flagellar assembly factor FliW